MKFLLINRTTAKLLGVDIQPGSARYRRSDNRMEIAYVCLAQSAFGTK
jgi:hypothetical protein